MIIQCIARKHEHLSLSLLEVHTLVHIICAVAMYGFWLRKPLNVQDLTLLDSNEHGELLALMTMLSPSLTTPHGERSSLSEIQLLRYEGRATQADRRSPLDLIRSASSPPGPESVKIISRQEEIQIPHLTVRKDGETFTLRYNQIDIKTGFGSNFGPKTEPGQQPLSCYWPDRMQSTGDWFLEHSNNFLSFSEICLLQLNTRGPLMMQNASRTKQRGFLLCLRHRLISRQLTGRNKTGVLLFS